MKTWALGLLNLVFFSAAAGAMPHASLNQLVQQADPDCNQTSSANGLREFIQQINVPLHKDMPGGDPRMALSKAAFLKDSQSQLQENVGDIFCPGITNSSVGTGVITNEDGTLLTTAHILLNGSKNFDALETCFWQNKVPPPNFKRFPIDARTFKPFTRQTDSEYFKDLAIVKLKLPLDKRGIPKFRPFAFDNPAERLDFGDELVMVSSFGHGMKDVPVTKELIRVNATTTAEFVYSHEAIAQKCMAQETGKSDPSVVKNGVFSDCASLSRDSGAPVFVVRNGQLKLKAINTKGGKAPNGTPYSKSAGSGAFGVQIDTDVLNQLQILQAENDKGRSYVESRPGLVHVTDRGL